MQKLFPRQYAKVLYRITKELSGKDLDSAVLEFFKLLKKNNSLKKVDIIVEHFLKYTKEQEGIETIKITSAHKISKGMAEQIATKFSEHFELELDTDKSLIGGVKVKKGNVIYDASVKTQLSNLNTKLTK